jgi:hypothetical protein
MADVPDNITLKQLCAKAAEALLRSGLDRRIDIYREVEVDDPAIRLMLGRPHRLRVRVKITATSLLFESGGEGNTTIRGGADEEREVGLEPPRE